MPVLSQNGNGIFSRARNNRPVNVIQRALLGADGVDDERVDVEALAQPSSAPLSTALATTMPGSTGGARHESTLQRIIAAQMRGNAEMQGQAQARSLVRDQMTKASKTSVTLRPDGMVDLKGVDPSILNGTQDVEVTEAYEAPRRAVEQSLSGTPPASTQVPSAEAASRELPTRPDEVAAYEKMYAFVDAALTRDGQSPWPRPYDVDELLQDPDGVRRITRLLGGTAKDAEENVRSMKAPGAVETWAPVARRGLLALYHEAYSQLRPAIDDAQQEDRAEFVSTQERRRVFEQVFDAKLLPQMGTKDEALSAMSERLGGFRPGEYEQASAHYDRVMGEIRTQRSVAQARFLGSIKLPDLDGFGRENINDYVEAKAAEAAEIFGGEVPESFKASTRRYALGMIRQREIAEARRELEERHRFTQIRAQEQRFERMIREGQTVGLARADALVLPVDDLLAKVGDPAYKQPTVKQAIELRRATVARDLQAIEDKMNRAVLEARDVDQWLVRAAKEQRDQKPGRTSEARREQVATRKTIAEKQERRQKLDVDLRLLMQQRDRLVDDQVLLEAHQSTSGGGGDDEIQYVTQREYDDLIELGHTPEQIAASKIVLRRGK